MLIKRGDDLKITVFFCFIYVCSVSFLSIYWVDYEAGTSQSGVPFLVQFDSLVYRFFAMRMAGDPFSMFFSYIEAGNYRFNLVGISTIGALIASVSKNNFDIIVVLVNGLVFTAAVFNYRRVFFHMEMEEEFRKFLIFIIFTPVLFQYGFGLNKDIFSFFLVALFLRLGLERRYAALATVAVCAYFLRQHYAAIGFLFLLFLRYRIHPGIVLMVMSVSLFALPGEFWGIGEFYLDDDRISSRQLMLFLAEINSYPGGYFIVLPARLALNMVQPIWPPNIIKSAQNFVENQELITLLFHHVTGVTAAGAVGFFVWLRVKTHLKIPYVVGRFLWAFVLVNGLVALLHPRYFFPLIPVMILGFLYYRSEMKKNGY